MQAAGPPSRFPLQQLNAAASGSEIGPRPQKDEVSSFSDPSSMRSMMIFYLFYFLCLCLSVACVVCVCVWNSQWRGGFAWDGSSREFNWHPVLMVTGLVVLYGNGAVLYRIPLTWAHSKLPWKILHAALMFLSLILSIVGLCAVFNVHNAGNIPNLYSLHSWIGIAATALFAFQWVAGFAGFLLPWTPLSMRKLLKPVHVWLGGSILILSIAASISGINEKLFFVLKGTTNGTQPYSSLPPEAVVANSLGVLIVAFGLIVLKILSTSEWQRPDGSEDRTYAPLLRDESD
ncbi:cytochrome b ascorbate-dependent protein 3 isoform X1 [Oryzias melastigma]|uniref:cytochrome b ascorbate-dependent protein 3 isoform X1 n=2 Tax=Oryzias melastigma TaxID=30732 RepID=UPI000CF7C15F|nr:cytochrome b ascorbate-dependent protein 3 isoform X1 [Oryzias melastigma]XP_024131715.1 cytochrome b ascorbate-dependent protein 3 isoform X1 [Oryzias melastigma]